MSEPYPRLHGPEYRADHHYGLLLEYAQRLRPDNDADAFMVTDSAAGREITCLFHLPDKEDAANQIDILVESPSRRLRAALFDTLDRQQRATISAASFHINRPDVARTLNVPQVAVALQPDGIQGPEPTRLVGLSYETFFETACNGGLFEPASFAQRLGRRTLSWLDETTAAYGDLHPPGSIPYF